MVLDVVAGETLFGEEAEEEEEEGKKVIGV